MCGACGHRNKQDQWSAVLGARRARWEAAQVVNRLLRGSGHPARVSFTAGSWVVRSGTGRDVVADTVTELWQAVRVIAEVDPQLFAAGGEGAAATEVARAVAASCEQGRRTVAC